jgi:hypothetical protein
VQLPSFAALAAASSLLAIACSSSSSGGAPPVQNAGNGVNDVKQACAIRTAWTQRISTTCSTCLSEAPVPACECDTDPHRAQCLQQSQAKTNEADCTRAISDCTVACHDDCACVDACYAGHDACRVVASALDGCVAAVCDSSCR